MVSSVEDFGVSPMQEIFQQILMVSPVEDFGVSSMKKSVQ